MDIGSVNKSNLNKTIWGMAIPVILQTLLQSLLGFVDTAVVGRLGSESIAAISLANTAVFAMIVIGNAFCIGGQVLVTRYAGSKNRDESKLAIGQSIVIVTIISIGIFFIYLIFGKEILKFMGAEGEVLNIAYGYLMIVNIATPASMIAGMMFSISRGIGDCKMPLYISGMMNLVNIILNIYFVFGEININIGNLSLVFQGLDLKGNGAAIATAISNILALVLVIIAFLRNELTRVKLNSFKPNKKMLRKIFGIGVPSAIEAFFVRLAFVLYTKIIMGIGSVAMAAHSVANTAESISFMPGFAFGSIIITFVGQFLGANDLEMARESKNSIDKMSMVVMGIFGVVFILFPELFIRLFSTDEEVIKLAATVLRVEGVAQIFFSRFNVYSGVLKAMGDTKKILIISMIGLWGVRLPLTLILINVFGMGLIGAWIPMCLDYVVKAVVVTIMVKKIKWNEECEIESESKLCIE